MEQITLEGFLKDLEYIDYDLKKIILFIANATILINTQIRKGALAGVLGATNEINIQGEQQKTLDIIANRIVIDNLGVLPSVAGIATEEEEHAVIFHPNGKYLIIFDPLDGSSNIDINISIGTIFSVLPNTDGNKINDNTFLQPGKNQLFSGYALYGPQTQFVFTFGNIVYIFTLDEHQYCFTKSVESIPSKTSEFAINASNYRHWDARIREYYEELILGETGIRKRNFNMRWIASMVAEVHRILMRGGLFIYPSDVRVGYEYGKLRILYEANPMSLIIKAVNGGAATNLISEILELEPKSLHQRIEVVLGSEEEVKYLQQKFKD